MPGKSQGCACHVVIGEGITSLVDYCLDEFEVDTVTLPSTITTLTEDALCADWINVLYLGDKMTLIEEDALPNIKSIEASALETSWWLLEVTVPSTVENVSKNAFWYCYNVLYDGSLDTSDWGSRVINGYYDGDTLYDSPQKEILYYCFESMTCAFL